MARHRPSELHKLGIKPKKGLSQNFLIDQNILNKFVRAAELESSDRVLEIGPGAGALTERLLAAGAHVIAVEKDPQVAQTLSHLKEHPNLQLTVQDALEFSIEEIIQPFKIVANLPFNVAIPLIIRFLPMTSAIHSLTLLVQKEIGERICAKKNSPLYNSLSLFVQAHSNPRICFRIPPNAFFPAPSVTCCVIHLELKSFPFHFPAKEFFDMTRTAFNQRRKMLRSSLRHLFSSQTVLRALEAMKKLSSTRPQELTLEEFGTFFQRLKEYSE